MNNITITGSLGKDSETRYLNDGSPVTSFSVADSQGRDKQTIWWNCAIFGERGDKLAPYLKKGQAVTVIGTVTEREYTDKEGVNRKAFSIRVNDVALQGGQREQAPAAPQKPAKPSHDAARARQLPKQQSSGFDDMEDSIPF